ncbi:hypothetical protein EHQ53_14185 [Leptospira langatensis]|uniref:VRR-NUC domain-containing protein n=1 Tax=Leptospira langatensis TaxID=2484983 RepID=A0ABY2MB37_9LEPT|nr:hypothetical protein [Leptospira langatensis]TGL39667.1 hypothetical protein EHQ53_14185 [Leptospira langatensis]
MGKREESWTNILTKSVISFLNWNGCVAWRRNQIPVPGRAFIGKKGEGDIIFIFPNGRAGWIEIKNQDELSDDQISFSQQVRGNGAFYLVVRKFEDILGLEIEVRKERERTLEAAETFRSSKEILDEVERIGGILGVKKELIEKAKAEDRKNKELSRRETKRLKGEI